MESELLKESKLERILKDNVSKKLFERNFSVMIAFEKKFLKAKNSVFKTELLVEFKNVILDISENNLLMLTKSKTSFSILFFITRFRNKSLKIIKDCLVKEFGFKRTGAICNLYKLLKLGFIYEDTKGFVRVNFLKLKGNEKYIRVKGLFDFCLFFLGGANFLINFKKMMFVARQNKITAKTQKTIVRLITDLNNHIIKSNFKTNKAFWKNYHKQKDLKAIAKDKNYLMVHNNFLEGSSYQKRIFMKLFSAKLFVFKNNWEAVYLYGLYPNRFVTYRFVDISCFA
ncbi:hypothetical protein [Ureaplasma parvum]|uniref:hypothetical protein n=1 Tax=Ureaplasma parvum TaxID=134821 RepID=UPI0026F3104D|nr:hypothetical protein [Ureaplasma parvum]